MTCGIYAIVCDKTWRSYVGQTKNFETRFLDHMQNCRRGKHFNTDFQKDFDSYGEESFYYEMLEEIFDESKLGEREAYWINFGENLYNKTNPSKVLILSKEEQIRFWKWVDITEENKCWNWLGTSDKDGYGRISFFRNNKKMSSRANRIAYFLHNPNSDINLIVRHICHNSKCCNPSHLIIGTNSDNKRDLLNKENNHYILNWNIVNDIRNKFLDNPNINPKDLLNWFEEKYMINLPKNHLVDIGMNRSWIDKNYTIPDRTLRYYITSEDVTMIKEIVNTGIPTMKCFKEIQKINNRISKTNCLRTIRLINKGEI